jgi:hypothetical protein
MQALVEAADRPFAGRGASITEVIRLKRKHGRYRHPAGAPGRQQNFEMGRWRRGSAFLYRRIKANGIAMVPTLSTGAPVSPGDVATDVSGARVKYHSTRVVDGADLAAGLVKSVVVGNLGRHRATDEGTGIVREIEARLLGEGGEHLPIGTVVNAAVDSSPIVRKPNATLKL